MNVHTPNYNGIDNIEGIFVQPFGTIWFISYALLLMSGKASLRIRTAATEEEEAFCGFYVLHGSGLKPTGQWSLVAQTSKQARSGLLQLIDLMAGHIHLQARLRCRVDDICIVGLQSGALQRRPQKKQ